MTIQQQHIVRVVCDRPRLEVAGIIGSESTPFTSGGRGGWEAVSRPRRSAMVEWVGGPEETSELVLRLRSDPTGDVDAALERLERMARSGADGSPPPLVRIVGLVPAAGQLWALQGMSVDETEREASGAYESCLGTLEMLSAEHTGEALVSGRVQGVYRARKGDTLTKLAIRFYGSARHAKALGKAQRPVIRDVRKKIRAGRVLVLP